MIALTELVAFITGGGSGIGRATAERFVAAGATVVAADINDPSLVAAEIGASAMTLDVTEIGRAHV